MAKKKEEQLSYLQMPLPKGQKKTRTVKVNWSGLNYRQTLDTGSLSKEKNISVSEAPYLTPFGTFEEFLDFGERFNGTWTKVIDENGNDVKNENEEVVYTSKGYVVDGICACKNYLIVLCHIGVKVNSSVEGYVIIYDEQKKPRKSYKLTYLDYSATSNSGFETRSQIPYFKIPRLHCDSFKKDSTITVGSNELHTYSNLVLVFSSYFNQLTDIGNPNQLTEITGVWSFRIPDVVDVPYEKGSKQNASLRLKINPWRFVDRFVNKDVIYNVTKNPFVKIPNSDDIKDNSSPFGEYLYKTNYKLTADDKVNESWILGPWVYTGRNSGANWYPMNMGDDGSIIEADVFSGINLSTVSTNTNLCPTMNDTTVFQGRLFGINKTRVYASEFNNYAGWTFDDATGINSSNAWMSIVGSSSTEDGDLTAITSYIDRVVVFSENAMYEIRNTKNPFRVVDIFREGCLSKEAVQVVNGFLIFVNKKSVMLYTGSRPKDIGYGLGFNKVNYAVTGSDEKRFYLYCETDVKEKNLFIYDTVTGNWSEADIENRVKCFANNANGFYMLCDNNKVYKLNEDAYSGDWMVETDFYTGRTIDIKHLQKIQMLAEMGPKSHFEVYILYDNEEYDDLPLDECKNRRVCLESNASENKRNALVRVIPRKNANYGFKIRIQGSGYVKLYQMELTITGGGELFNE